MIQTDQINDDTLVIYIYYKEFEIISQSRWHNSIDLNFEEYGNVFYDTKAMYSDFWRTQEDITVKQLRDRHKRKHNQICFQSIDSAYIHKIYLEEPDWDISKDAYGNTCIRMTWKGFRMSTDTPDHSIPILTMRGIV